MPIERSEVPPDDWEVLPSGVNDRICSGFERYVFPMHWILFREMPFFYFEMAVLFPTKESSDLGIC